MDGTLDSVLGDSNGTDGNRNQAQAAIEPPRIEASQLRDRLAHGEPIVLVDARPPEEWNRSPLKIAEAVRIPPEPDPGVGEEVAQALPRDASVVVYCASHTERWSARLARFLMQHGFDHVSVLRGGFEAWRAVGGPIALR